MVQISFCFVFGGVHILLGLFEHSWLRVWRIEDVSHLGASAVRVAKALVVARGRVQCGHSHVLSEESRGR